MTVSTTPTGQIGRQVLANVLDGTQPVRVIVRDPDRLPDQVRGRVSVASTIEQVRRAHVLTKKRITRS